MSMFTRKMRMLTAVVMESDRDSVVKALLEKGVMEFVHIGLLPADITVIDIPQELEEGARSRVVEDVRALSPADRGRVLSTVAQLNSDPDRILEGGRTSPGELRKLMLAEGILRHPQLIVMDEPTNHLDLHSTEALERALAAYPGALVLVSHDRRFLSACTDRTWEVRGGLVREA